mmetsp:Transcript_50001/g.121380  ORF Transcript_50001/g.121380 Transcript_50001/m.121380 type:complete len:218 (-) Transcript_50001:541-1194(-)
MCLPRDTCSVRIHGFPFAVSSAILCVGSSSCRSSSHILRTRTLSIVCDLNCLASSLGLVTGRFSTLWATPPLEFEFMWKVSTKLKRKRACSSISGLNRVPRSGFASCAEFRELTSLPSSVCIPRSNFTPLTSGRAPNCGSLPMLSFSSPPRASDCCDAVSRASEAPPAECTLTSVGPVPAAAPACCPSGVFDGSCPAGDDAPQPILEVLPSRGHRDD